MLPSLLVFWSFGDHFWSTIGDAVRRLCPCSQTQHVYSWWCSSADLLICKSAVPFAPFREWKAETTGSSDLSCTLRVGTNSSVLEGTVQPAVEIWCRPPDDLEAFVWPSASQSVISKGWKNHSHLGWRCAFVTTFKQADSPEGLRRKTLIVKGRWVLIISNNSTVLVHASVFR